MASLEYPGFEKRVMRRLELVGIGCISPTSTRRGFELVEGSRDPSDEPQASFLSPLRVLGMHRVSVSPWRPNGLETRSPGCVLVAGAVHPPRDLVRGVSPHRRRPARSSASRDAGIGSSSRHDQEVRRSGRGADRRRRSRGDPSMSFTPSGVSPRGNDPTEQVVSS